MHKRVILPAASVALGAIVLPLFLYMPAQAATTCPNPGERPATAADLPLMQAAGYPANYIKVGNCWNPSNKYIGEATAKAKQDLQGMWCGHSNASCSYQGVTYTSTISGLDPKFASCADRFMQALRQLSPGACINSAYRSTAQQACACVRTCPDHNPNGCSGLCAKPGHSYHQRGLAIDVGDVHIPEAQFWNLALHFGIGNPTGLHKSDPFHIQAMNGGINCASVGYMPTSGDVFVSGPASNNPYFGYQANPLPSMPPPQAPMTPIQPFSPQPTTPTNPTNTGTQSSNTTGTSNTSGTQSSSATSCTPKYFCQGSEYYYQDSKCKQVPLQSCQYGCNGDLCATASGSSATQGSNINISDLLTSQAKTATQAATGSAAASSENLAQIIRAYATPANTASTSATTTPIALNKGTASSSGTIASSTVNPVLQKILSGIPNTPPPTPAQASQTFTSSDLSQSPSVASSNPLADLLGNLRQTLIRLWDYLSPFKATARQ